VNERRNPHSARIKVGQEDDIAVLTVPRQALVVLAT